MRSRNIKPGFFKNEQLAELSAEARLLYIGLWMMADREGRLEDRPKRIKMEIFPADSFDCEPFLSGLADRGLIVRYGINGHQYIEIPKFLDHQRPHYTEKDSLIPPRIPGKEPHDDLITPENSGKPPPGRGGHSALNPDLLNPDLLNGQHGHEERKIPDWSSIKNLDLDWWQIWLAHRRAERHRPYKTTRVAEALAKFPQETQRLAIEQSMAKGWVGLFPEKINAENSRRAPASTRFDEHTRRLAQWFEQRH